jgi:hypothetical protein
VKCYLFLLDDEDDRFRELDRLDRLREEELEAALRFLFAAMSFTSFLFVENISSSTSF